MTEFNKEDKLLITEEGEKVEPLSMHGVRLGDEAVIVEESNSPYDWMVDVFRDGELIIEGIGVKESELSPMSCGEHKTKLVYSKSRGKYYCPFCND